MASSAVALFVINLTLGISLRVPHGRTLWAILGLGLISQLGGYLALTYALGHLPATITSISLLTQGPLTAAMAALLLGEPLTLPQIVGGALVLSGVGLAHRQWHRKTKPTFERESGKVAACEGLPSEPRLSGSPRLRIEDQRVQGDEKCSTSRQDPLRCAAGDDRKRQQGCRTQKK